MSEYCISLLLYLMYDLTDIFALQQRPVKWWQKLSVIDICALYIQCFNTGQTEISLAIDLFTPLNSAVFQIFFFSCLASQAQMHKSGFTVTADSADSSFGSAKGNQSEIEKTITCVSTGKKRLFVNVTVYLFVWMYSLCITTYVYMGSVFA